MFANENIGASLNLARKLENVELLFGECPSVIIVTISEENLYNLVALAKKHDIHTQTIGKVTDNGKMTVNDLISIDRKKMEESYFNSLKNRIHNA